MTENPEEMQSQAGLARIRRRYYAHSVLNGISFRLLAGNIITLYALNLGADNTYVGVLSSFAYISLLFLLVGRPLVNRLGAVRVQSTFWFIRYSMMIPILLTALPGVATNQPLTFALVAVAVLGFHSSKGIALAGQQTILGSVVGEKGRGAVLSRIQSLNTTVSTVVWLVVGIVLTGDPTRIAYAGIFLVGIIAGTSSSAVLSTLPEPAGNAQATGALFLQSVRAGFSNDRFRRLMTLLFTKNVFLGMTGAFLIVQFKAVYGHSDSSIVFITLIGSLGVIAMAAAAGLLMDRMGARPLYFAFAVITAASILPIVFGPDGGTTLIAWLIPSVAFFLYNIGANGMMNCSQDYLFATISSEERLNLGIVYHIVAGIAGFIGSVGGGLALDAILARPDLADAAGYRLYFGVMFVTLVGVSLLVTRLPDIGAYSILNTISVLFSPRDLRAIRILKRLGTSTSVDHEREMIRELGRSPSKMAVEDLLTKLKSPSFQIRAEALTSLRLHPVDHAVIRALEKEVTDHEYTTAHMAAETIGMKRIREAAPALREALESGDFMLCGKAMVALAELNDLASLHRILTIFTESANPRVIIHGARALATFRDPLAVTALVQKLEPSIAPFVRDEIILAIAEVLGFEDRFYPAYILFLERNLAGTAELLELTTASEADVRTMVLEVTGDPAVFAVSARRVYASDPPSVAGFDLQGIILEALENPTILALVRFRFLAAAIPVMAGNGPGSV